MKPRLRFSKPIEIPLRIPNPTTVLGSKGLCSNNFIHSATWREQKVTSRCQLVKVVAAIKQSLPSTLSYPLYLRLGISELKPVTATTAQFENLGKQ